MFKQYLTQENSELDHKEWRVLKSLNTPAKVQNFINSLHFDFKDGDKIDRSVRGILKTRKADCAGGAVFAAAALWVQGREPLLLDMVVTDPNDFDHILAPFKEGRHWGAISKTNHAVLRYREPVYRDTRELVMSYFHEYFLPNGKKTLRNFSQPFNLSHFGAKWLTDKDAVMDIIHKIDVSPHIKILSTRQTRNLRKADKIEVKAGQIVEYKQS